MIKRYLASLLIVLAPMYCCAAEGADSPEGETPFAELPKESRVKLDRLVELAEHAYVNSKSTGQMEKEHKKFQKLLLELGGADQR